MLGAGGQQVESLRGGGGGVLGAGSQQVVGLRGGRGGRLEAEGRGGGGLVCWHMTIGGRVC